MTTDLTLPKYGKAENSIRDHWDAYERALRKNWRSKKNYPTVLTRREIHKALSETGFGIIDLEGLSVQRVRDLDAAERFAEQITSLQAHAVSWPVKDWITRGVSDGSEVYVIKDRGTRDAIGFIGFKREIDFEDYGCNDIYINYDLSAIYVASDYAGMGCATALFHALIADLQLTVDFVKASWRGLEISTGQDVALTFLFTGEAHSSGGAGCGASVFRAFNRAVKANFKHVRSKHLHIDVVDDFDYGIREDWKDLAVDTIPTAA